MITIAVTNQKGGEGKTTTSINLSDGLARRGKKTILIDTDPQSNSTSIYLNPNNITNTIYNLYQDKNLKLKEIVYPSEKENLSVVPSSPKLAEMESVSGNNVEAPFFLRDSLEGVGDYDFCIIDCPPSLSIFTINALVAANYVLVPLQAEKFSVDGILGLQQTITSIKKRINPNLEVLGALITQLKPQTLLTKTIIPILDKYFKVFDTSISDGVAIGESHLARCSIYDYNKKCRQSKEYEEFIEEVLNELKK
jgi:chromosome partitioning protein